MTRPLLLDTHVVLWLDSGDERLRPSIRQSLDNHWQGGGLLAVSAVTAWEIAALVDAGRIALDRDASGWFERFVDRPGIEAIPLTWRAASIAYRVEGLQHRDPADRLLIATAVELGGAFVTQDARIIRFAERFGQACGLAVSA